MTSLTRLSLALAAALALVAGSLRAATGVIRNAPVPVEGQTFPASINLDETPAPAGINLNERFTFTPATSGDFARITTPFGDIYIEFFADDAPLTVANFKSYLATDSTPSEDLIKTYDDTFIHRSVTNFVLQAGGYKIKAPLDLLTITKQAAVTNEFKVANTRGTLAMAKLGNQPNSATNEWFINLADNRANLDNQNGGFTAFARILGDGMAIADKIAALKIYDVDGNGGSTFDNVPLQSLKGDLKKSNFIELTKIREVSADDVPASARTLPLSYSIIANTHPDVAAATIDRNGVFTLRKGKSAGLTRITLRVQAVGGHFLDVPLEVTRSGLPVIVTQLPATTTKPFGASATLVASTTMFPAGSIQWERKPAGGAWAPIPEADPLFTGETDNTLRIALNTTANPAAAFAALQDSQFRFVLTNPAGTVTSKPTTLKITTLKTGFSAQPAALTTGVLGGSVQIAVTALPVTANTPLAYKWQRYEDATKSWIDLVNSIPPTEGDDDTPADPGAPTPYTGVATKTLTVKLEDLQLDGAQFRCVISNALKDAPPPVAATGTAISKTASLRILAERRTLATAESKPLFGLVPGEGVTFSAKGLPAGLVLNAQTGVLSGTPTAKAGIYKVTVTIATPSGKSTRVYNIEVLSLSGNNAGGFEALLSPAGQPPLAKLELTIAGNGRVTGKLTTAEEKSQLSLSGAVVRSTSGVLSLASPIVIQRPGAPKGRTYELAALTIETNGRFSVKLFARESAAAEPVEIASALYIADAEHDDYPGNPGKRLGAYSKTNYAPWHNVGSYNLAITAPGLLDEDSEDERPFPAGSGYANAPVSVDGRLNFKGKLADGEKLTASLRGGTDASFRLFLRPYSAAPGSVLSAELPLTYPSIFFQRYSVFGDAGKDAYWTKPALPKTANYTAGFGPLGITVRLEPWYPSSFADFGFVATDDNNKGKTDLFLSGADLGASSAELPANLAVTYKVPKATFVDFAIGDASKFTGTLNTTTGFFSGSFILVDPIPGTSPLKTTTRKVPFEGTLLMAEELEGGTVTAEGFTLVPSLTGGKTATSSGRIQFKNPVSEDEEDD